MAVYAVGDIQGCYTELRNALDEVGFESDRDRLWSVGDMVNRGPRSLDVVRFLKGLGESAVCVLGNHDLHLLAIAAAGAKSKRDDTLAAILAAPDRDELLHWLRHCPLAHFDRTTDFLMIHAGLPPEWDTATTLACADEVQQVLRGDSHHEYFRQMYGNKPDLWSSSLQGMSRWRFITNCLTRLRFCHLSGRLALKEKGPPGTQPKDCVPWFRHPQRASRGQRIVFGHWSTLGYHAADNVWGLDTGCLWGGKLTLLRLDGAEPQPHNTPCATWQEPKNFA